MRKVSLENYSTEAFEKAYLEEKQRHHFLGVVRGTVFILTVVAAIAVLVAILVLPVLRIYGESMQGSLNNGNVVISVKSGNFKRGDIIAFYYNNNVLVKRVIAKSNDWVDIDKEGNIFVNQVKIDEPYLKKAKAFGQTNIELPFQVPEGRLFVVGDNRENSIDSRNKTIGTISQEQIVGKIFYRVWPLEEFGTIR